MVIPPSEVLFAQILYSFFSATVGSYANLTSSCLFDKFTVAEAVGDTIPEITSRSSAL